MARLAAKRRKALPKSSFAYPRERKYPIHDKAHARNALSRAAQKGTYGTYAHVRAAVARKFPSIGKSGTKRKTKTKSRRRGTSARRRR
jgi:hypothetical protein